MEEARKSSIDHRQEKRAAKRKQETDKVPTPLNGSSVKWPSESLEHSRHN